MPGREVVIQSRGYPLLLAVLALGCEAPGRSSAPVSELAGQPEAGLGADEALELAQAVARAGLPSPNPELDALASMVEATTPGLGLEDLLASQEASQRGTVAPALRVGDRVAVRVLGREEFTGEHLLGPEGRIEMPLVGSVAAAGQTPGELAEGLRRTLEASFLRRADVSVRVVDRGARAVTVAGRVRTPGVHELPVDRPLSLHALLALAGGFEEDADGSRLALIRTAGDERRCYHVPYRELLGAHLQGREAWLLPDDQLVVPRLPEAFVYGAVQRPGRIPLRPGATVSGALFQAGGLAEDADSRELRVLDGEGEGRRVAPETRLEAGQVVFVPRRHRVYVIGAVTNNGPLALPRSGLTILQALAEAGWFTDAAKIHGTEILRTVGGRPQRIVVPVDQILAGERADAEFPLLPGDVVVVPERIW